eukprot:TRINITY_DN2002_c0_g1_i5.p1 TRINITY_DN2002_c0_g1~~TRINITY_DN2002_c0_g1_i5.p1  ORF type:complete len:520 (+),score=145.09 TRINITY_DN2002_c0_g1_i5:898-2457(+)
MADPRDRHQAQRMAQHVGNALHEIVYATAPIAHLIRDVQLGDRPGAFHLPSRPSADMAPFVASHMQVGAGRQGAVPADQREQASATLSLPQAQELEAALKVLIERLNEIGTLPSKDAAKTKAFTDSITSKLAHAIEHKYWHSKINTLLPETLRIEHTHERILLEALAALSINEGYELYKGNFEVVGAAVPSILRLATEGMAKVPTPEEEKAACNNLIAELNKAIVVPNELRETILPGFKPVAGIGKILNEYFEKIMKECVCYLKEHNSKKLAEVVKPLIAKMIAESIDELSEGFHNEYAGAILLIKHNIELMLTKFESEELGFVLSNLLTKPLLNFIEGVYAQSKNREEVKEIKKTHEEEVKSVHEEKKVTEAAKKSEEDQEKKEVKKAEKPEVKKVAEAIIPEEWKEIIEKDMKLQQNIKSQRPLSHVYVLTDTKRGPRSLAKEFDDPLKDEMATSLRKIKTNREDIVDAIDDITDELENDYFKLLKLEFIKRIKEDADYDPTKYEYLEKFVSEDKRE